MPKAVTTKDVIYALEYAGEQLVIRSGTGKRGATLMPSRNPVPQSIVQEIMRTGSVVRSPLSSPEVGIYVWVDAA